MSHLFALEQDSTTHTWANIHYPIDFILIWVQAEHAVSRVWQVLNLVDIVVQENNQGELAQFRAMKFIVFVMDVRVFVATV